MKRKIIFISGPYSSRWTIGRILNVLHAWRWAYRVWKHGGGALCPHASSFLMDSIPPEAFYEVDLRLLRACDAILMLPGWIKSKGARLEACEAKVLGKQIFVCEKIEELWAWLRT